MIGYLNLLKIIVLRVSFQNTNFLLIYPNFPQKINIAGHFIQPQRVKIHSYKQQPMRQKRQHFQKQIRREALDKIFKEKRQKHFNFTYNDLLPSQIINQIKDQCYGEFTRFIHGIQEALKEGNQEELCMLIRQSALFLKRILKKGKDSAICITFIVQNWYNFTFDQMLYESAALFMQFSQQQFSGIRKQAFRYALEHFSLIYEYEGLITKKDNYEDHMFEFLFAIMVQLQNDCESIRDIMDIVLSMIVKSTKIRHAFFFNNYLWNQKEFEKGARISFGHIITAIYQNRDKMNMPNNVKQERDYHNLRMLFIDFVNMYFLELKDMEKYIDKCRSKGANKNIPEHLKKQDDIYETTLSLRNFPPEVHLKYLLESHEIAVIHDEICNMKTLSFSNVSKAEQEEAQEYQENLATCLQAFRGLIEFHPSEKILRDFQNELQFLVEKLIAKEYNVVVKKEIVILLDTIIFIDKENKMTHHLIRYQDLFDRIWSYQDSSVSNVKLNILNNIILSDAGFDAAMRRFSQIQITLYQTKYVNLALTFCINYFVRTDFSSSNKVRFDSVIEILYSLPKEYFGVEEMEKDFYLFSKLYNLGFSQPLPQRYSEWKNEESHLSIDQDKHINQEKKYEMQQKTFLFQSMKMLQSQHVSDINSMEE